MSASFPTLDNFDRKILEIVQKSNRTTSEQIAEQIGLSSAAVQRRLKRLRNEQVIVADASIVNPKALERNMTFIVQVSLEREHANLIHNFKKKMLNNPQVQQCYYVTGTPDFILIITAFSMDDYDVFTQETFFSDNSNIRSFQTNVAMDAVKVGLQLPVDENK
ncbi:Lrp/AsnC family transcriptional regulator [Marinomonas sp.]|nr:Lrp/AsnC family transcriptional regulator [Marinomonas sp.]MDB4837585.1 Lrp/AsnC family transcriptional regulator [Marinomonas sp.]